MNRAPREKDKSSKSARKGAPGERSASKKLSRAARGRKAAEIATKPRRHLAAKATAETLLADLPLPGSIRKQVTTVLATLERKTPRKPKKVL